MAIYQHELGPVQVSEYEAERYVRWQEMTPYARKQALAHLKAKIDLFEADVDRVARFKYAQKD